MLSILIPVYNFDVRKLVFDLLSQIDEIECPVELLLLDDGSHLKWQDQYANWSDSTVVDKIGNYQVICGGHVYQENRPSDEYVLHWKYGQEVEVRSVDVRNKKPYTSFSTFNFYCKKSVFVKHLNDINISGYGHEDTLVGHILLNNNVSIQHIQNPLIHSGLKNADDFLADTESAIGNAFLIQKKYPNVGIKLISNVKRIKSSGMATVIRSVLGINRKSRIKNLKSNNPSIHKLQLHKLFLALAPGA